MTTAYWHSYTSMACYRAKTKVAKGIALFILMLEVCSAAKRFLFSDLFNDLFNDLKG